MVGVDSGRLQADSQPKSSGLVLVGGCLVPFYIHKKNWVNSRNGLP